MEGNGRKLAWIAIALSAVALVVALGGRAQSHMAMRGGRDMMGPQAWGQQAPQGQFQQGPQGQFQQGPQGQFQQGPQGQGQFGRQRGPGMMGQRGGMNQRGGGMPFFLLPFMLIGKLIKLAALIALIWLGIKLIRGRRPAAPAASAAWSGASPPPSARPGPEQPPYTDETQQL